MKTVTIPLNTKEILDAQEEKLRKRVRRYFNFRDKGKDQKWTTSDAVCILNLLNVYHVSNRWGSAVLNYRSLKEIVEGENKKRKQKQPTFETSKKKKVVVRKTGKVRRIIKRKG